MARRDGGMMVDDLEPGHEARKRQVPGLRRPPRPHRADDVLESYQSDRMFEVPCETPEQAEKVAREINAAVYWLNKWVFEEPDKKYNLRVRPKITEHYRIDGDGGPTYFAAEVTRDVFDRWEREGRQIEHFWLVQYYVHLPLKRGFSAMSPAKLREAHESSADTRGVTITSPVPPPRRTVVRRAY